MPSEYLFRNDEANSSAKPVLKCFDGAANIVSPGNSPPSTEPDNATLIIGTDVVIISFSVNNSDFSRDDVKSSAVANYHYGHKIDVKTGDHSPVSIHADINSIFGEYKKELEEKSPQNKQEISDALDILESEFTKEEKDQGKIKKSLGTIAKGAGWLYEKITNNQFIGSILAQIAIKQMGLP